MSKGFVGRLPDGALLGHLDQAMGEVGPMGIACSRERKTSVAY
jgi:hypothetical protein